MPVAKCRYPDCEEEITWLTTRRGKRIPVDTESLTEEDVELLNGDDEPEYRYGDHICHFETCKHESDMSPGPLSSTCSILEGHDEDSSPYLHESHLSPFALAFWAISVGLFIMYWA